LYSKKRKIPQNIAEDGNSSSRTDMLDDVLILCIPSPGKYQDTKLKTDGLHYPQSYLKLILV
jgi:hypothetical protein